MNLGDLFKKEFLVEAQNLRKTLKIIYEYDLELIEAKTPEVPAPEEPVQQEPAQQPQPVDNTQLLTTPIGQDQTPPNLDTDETSDSPENLDSSTDVETQAPQQESPFKPGISTSVSTEKKKKQFKPGITITEDEDSSDDNSIIEKAEGEINLTSEQVDNLQSFDDVIDILASSKKEGKPIANELMAETLALCSQNNYDALKQKLDKSSKIYFEIYLGYKKDDSVGVRFSKRKNSELLTQSMLVDNEIINAKFSIDNVNKQITEFRNYEVKKS